MSKTVRIRLAALVAAAATGLVGLVALALPSNAAGALTATYNRVQEWPGSYFQGQYTLANGTSAAVTSWTLTFTLPGGDNLANWWGANVTQSGGQFTAAALSGSSIAPGGTATMGFLVTEGGGLADPANCKLNGGSCTGGGTSPTPTRTTASPTPSRTTSPSPSPSRTTSPSPSPSRTGTPPPPAAWHPNYLALGTVYTPYASIDSWFTGAKSHGSLPNYGYQYLIGGDFANWPATTTTLVSHAHTLGMIPVLVEYGMNGNVDGSSVDYTNMQSSSWLTTFFRGLRSAAQAAATAAGSAPVGWVIEPDMLGYLQQNYAAQYGNDASQLPAATSSAHSSGVLTGTDPTFGNNLKGLVEAINYTIKKYDSGAFVGWQVNDWAVRNPLKDTDTMGITAGRQSVTNIGNQVGAFTHSADIGYHADFVAFDQWGQDFGILRDPNPAGDIRYLNATHWDNYLLNTWIARVVFVADAVADRRCGHGRIVAATRGRRRTRRLELLPRLNPLS